MQQTHWHLEMYAREMEQQRRREAELARQLFAAGLPSGAVSGLGLFAGIGRAIARLRRGAEAASVPTARTLSPAPAAPDVALVATAPAAPQAMSQRRLPRQTDPYAGMAVVARGQLFVPADEPCHAREC
jgi:hypothetical protein